MTINQLAEQAYKNLIEAPGTSTTNPTTRIISSYVNIDDTYIGKPFALTTIETNTIDLTGNEEALDEWCIPEKLSFVGVYMGKMLTYEGQKNPEMTFFIPTNKGNYEVFITKSGQIFYYGGGDDEPALLSGIGVKKAFTTNHSNTKSVNKKFDYTIKKLKRLAA